MGREMACAKGEWSGEAHSHFVPISHTEKVAGRTGGYARATVIQKS